MKIKHKGESLLKNPLTVCVCVCVCTFMLVVYRLNTFVVKKRREKLYRSIGQAEESPPKSESLQLNRCLMHLWQITPRIFPAVADIWLFICLEKKAWADETRGLKEAENGSIMSVGRLTYDILGRPVSREAKTACLSKMKGPTHTHTHSKDNKWHLVCVIKVRLI